MTTSTYWQQLQRQRLTRRRMLAVTGAGAAGLLIAAACGDSSSDAEPNATEAPNAGVPRHGGRYQQGIQSNLDTLDPHVSIAGGVAFFPRIYNLLIAQSALKPEFIYNDLAAEYEQPVPWRVGLRHRRTMRWRVSAEPRGMFKIPA